MNFEEFDLDEKEQDYLGGMGGDAGIVNISLFNSLAAMNPARWEAGNCDAIIASLSQHVTEERPVHLRVTGESYIHKFISPQAAINWIKNCNTKSSQGSPLHSLTSTIAQWTASPSLAIFCRTHSSQSWTNKHFFKAYSFASRTTNLPLELSERQSHHGEIPITDGIQRQEVAWGHFDALRGISAFIDIASQPTEK